MKSMRISTAKRIGKKAARVALLAAQRPSLLPLMWQGVHPEHFTRLNMRWLRENPPQTVLDIGANTGQFASAVHALFPKAIIVAFEPQEECYGQLIKRFGKTDGVRLIQSAVGDEDGETLFRQNIFSQSSSVLELTDLHRKSFPWVGESVTVQVPIRRLDSLAEELELGFPLLVKIDVQGYEDRVVRGGKQVISQAQYVLIETAFGQLYEGEANFDTVYELMLEYGFRYAGNLDQIANPATDLPLYADALFIKNH